MCRDAPDAYDGAMSPGTRSVRGRQRRRALLTIATVVVALGLPAPSAARADANEAPGAPAVVRGLTVGGDQTCSIRPGGSVRCWTPMDRDLPQTVPLGTGRSATALSAGEEHACALLDDGSIKCWGRNDVGQLGQGDGFDRPFRTSCATHPCLPVGFRLSGDDLDPIDLGSGRTAVAVAAGAQHTCAILDTGAVKCWGLNQTGQLGLGGVWDGQMGDALPAVDLGTGRTAVAITAGEQHTCAILDDGSVKCWGHSGFLGIGEGANSIASRGDEPADMGDNLPAVDLGTGHTAVAVAAGGRHTCALLDDASVKCWGDNPNGELGQGDQATRGDEPGEMGDELPSVDLGNGRTATAITAGVVHTCARLDDAEVKCWGENTHGQLGLGDTDRRGDGPGEMGDALPAVNVGTGRTVQAISAGGDRSCVVRDDASIRCWGAHASLALGDPHHLARTAALDLGDVPAEMGDGLHTIDFGAAPPPGGFRVDAELRRRDRATYVGDGIVNASGSGQSVTVSARPGTRHDLVVRLTNESSVTDSFQLAGPVESRWAWPAEPNSLNAHRFRVRYTNGIRDVTTKVGAGTFRFRDVPPGGTRTLVISLITESGSPSRNTWTAPLRVRSVGNPDLVDTVKPTVRVDRS